MEVATFGGGCFWCIEAVIQRLKGVEKIVSGYADGFIKNPSYREICSGTTGHAEVVQVTFDPEVISYEDLITIFMTSHDPTTLNFQGADRGTQYRSTILYHNDNQRNKIGKVIEAVQKVYSNPIITVVKPLDVFYEAEEYHQNYYNNNSEAGYCQAVIDPKIAKLRKLYADRLNNEN